MCRTIDNGDVHLLSPRIRNFLVNDRIRKLNPETLVQTLVHTSVHRVIGSSSFRFRLRRKNR